MIKRILFLGIFLILGSLAYAQTTTAPTKDDALYFINKVLANYHGNLDEAGLHYSSIETTTAAMDGCNLVFTIKFRTDNANTPLIRTKDIMTVFHTNVITVNLQNVYFAPGDSLLDKTFRANNSGDITETFSTQTLNGNGNFVGNDTSAPQNLSSYLIVRPLKYISDFPNPLDDQHYSERYVSAILFLVKSCGGGQIKAQASSDKF